MPFGPRPSIVFSSPLFHKKFANLKKVKTNILWYSSSTYHLFLDREYNGSKLYDKFFALFILFEYKNTQTSMPIATADFDIND